MLRKIYQELVLIRKELQAIRKCLESNKFIPEDRDGIRYYCGSSSGSIPQKSSDIDVDRVVEAITHRIQECLSELNEKSFLKKKKTASKRQPFSDAELAFIIAANQIKEELNLNAPSS